MFRKTLFSFFTISALSFGQILYSDVFPFQNINSETDSKQIYDLLLKQELFKNIEMEKYLTYHKTIAILPVEIKYVNLNNDNAQKLNIIESISAGCIYNDFLRFLKNYSNNFISMQAAIENKNTNLKEYVPQTEIDRHLDNKITKHTINLQEPYTTKKMLNNLKNLRLTSCTPEFLCAFLGVDAIIYISIHSDFMIPLKDCLKVNLLDDLDLLGSNLFFQFSTNKEKFYPSFQELKKLNSKTAMTNVFTSIYDKSGELIWLHGQSYSAATIWGSVFKSNKEPLINTFFAKTNSVFPYVINAK